MKTFILIKLARLIRRESKGTFVSALEISISIFLFDLVPARQ